MFWVRAGGALAGMRIRVGGCLSRAFEQLFAESVSVLAVRCGDIHPVYGGEGKKKEACGKLFFFGILHILNRQDEEFAYPEGV